MIESDISNSKGFKSSHNYGGFTINKYLLTKEYHD